MGSMCFHLLNSSDDLVVFSRISNADVSVGVWQHICFSIDATMRLWRLFKNGIFIETGISTIPVKDSGQIIVGSQVGKLS